LGEKVHRKILWFQKKILSQIINNTYDQTKCLVFFTGGSSSEDEGSGDDNNKEEEEPIKAPVKFTKTAGASSSSEEEVDVKRVVKSTRDKRYDELTETIQRIRNHMKINDRK